MVYNNHHQSPRRGQRWMTRSLLQRKRTYFCKHVLKFGAFKRNRVQRTHTICNKRVVEQSLKTTQTFFRRESSVSQHVPGLEKEKQLKSGQWSRISLPLPLSLTCFSDVQSHRFENSRRKRWKKCSLFPLWSH